MKAQPKRRQKVSLLFYSEEDGKKSLVDKWEIEIGKKYTIGRSKKKVDISIQDITISRIHSEFIFYDKDKIMVKDYNSSNGTFINRLKIEPNKEIYFSIRDVLSIGDEKKEFFFSIQNIEEETNNRNEFDTFEEKKNKNEEYKQNKINKNQKNYYENEKENENEEIKNSKYNKGRSNSFLKDYSSHSEKDYDNRYYEDEDKKYRYNKDKYRYNKDKDSGDKYEKDKYNKHRHRGKSRSRSRSRSSSRKKPYHKRDVGYKRKKTNNHKNHSSDSSSDLEKSSKKNKHKNILSYIIKQEEDIEKENDKRQIKLYNEYLKIKEETDAKLEMNNLPNLLPVLTAKSESEDSDIDSSEYKYKYEKRVKKEFIKLPPTFKSKTIEGNDKNIKRFNRYDYRNKSKTNKTFGFRNKVTFRRK